MTSLISTHNLNDLADLAAEDEVIDGIEWSPGHKAFKRT